jgi:hypothetical protein
MYQKELLPIEEPFIVADRIKLYKVEYAEKPQTYNELLEYTGDLTWVFDSGKAVGTYFIHQRTIDEVKELLIEKTLQRSEKMFNEDLIDYEYNGIVRSVASNVETLFLLHNTSLALNNRETAIVKIPSISGDSIDYMEINEQDLNNLSAAVHGHRNSILLQEKQTVEAIKAASSIEELKEIEV